MQMDLYFSQKHILTALGKLMKKFSIIFIKKEGFI